MQKLYYSKFINILFPVSLVLFELAVYIANDMIQPVMLEIIKDFNASVDWIPNSLTSYLVGGLLLQWFFGPLSDKYGRRPVMLFGILFFIISCLSVFYISNITQFIIVRFFQGIGLCFIGSVGYATIQEYFKELTCVKIIALMTNVALIAPLLGPILGATLMKVIEWKEMFIIFAILAFFSFIGLFFFMPETVIFQENKLSFYNLWNNYKLVFTNIRFIFGALAIGFSNLPLLSWIALSPVILISKENFSTFSYSLIQIPIFGGLILGNILLSFYIRKTAFLKIIHIGSYPILLGLIISGISTFFTDSYIYFWITTGLSIYALGLGMTSACLTRLTLFSSKIKKGTVSSSVGIISMIILILGIEISKLSYLYFNVESFNFINLLSGFLWLLFLIFFIKKLQ